MYPRNAASPEPIAIGPVVQISDGAVQSSGVTVRIKPVGVAEADGAGTTAYSTDGVVLYTPTQAETNYTSFVLIAKKTGCIPASVTVVTTASATAGYAGVDWGKVTAATSTVALSGTTISTSQAVASVSGAVGSVTGAVGSVTNRVTANTDQWGGVAVTGMPLPTDSYTAPLSAADTRTALGLASANLDTQLADIPTVTEFEARTLIASGYASSTHWTATRAGYLDGVLLADNYNIRVVSVTGSKHIASVVHSVEPAAIPEDAFVDGALSNRVLAANAAAEVATAVRTELAIELGRIDVTSSSRLASSAYTAPDNASITLIKTVTDRLNTGLVQDGAVWQFTVNMLENGPAGGGGGSATVGNQLLILDQLDLIQSKTDLISGASGITSLLAGAVLEPGQITSFPETLTIGDSYTSSNGRSIQIPVVDTNGTPISSTGSLYFSSATVTFAIKRAGETDSTRIISGTATFVDPPGTGTGDEAPYALIELSSSETAKGLMKYKYTGILTFTWPGTSDEVMSFETNTITFKE